LRTRHDGPTVDRHQAGPVLGLGRAVRPEPTATASRRAGRVSQGPAATAIAAAVRGRSGTGDRKTTKLVGRHGIRANGGGGEKLQRRRSRAGSAADANARVSDEKPQSVGRNGTDTEQRSRK